MENSKYEDIFQTKKIQDIVFEQKLWKRTKLLKWIILLKEQKGNGSKQ